jgi:hypothetical protein
MKVRLGARENMRFPIFGINSESVNVCWQASSKSIFLKQHWTGDALPVCAIIK